MTFDFDEFGASRGHQLRGRGGAAGGRWGKAIPAFTQPMRLACLVQVQREG